MKKQDLMALWVAELAMRSGRRCMASYAHPKSPKLFTQPQLLACLVLKTYFRMTYRGVIEILRLAPDLQEALGLHAGLPHFSTLQKFAAGAEVTAVLDAVLAEVVLTLNNGHPLETSDTAIDATGMQVGVASAHYRTRSGRAYTRWVRVSVVAMCALVMPVAMHVDWGPGNDAAPALTVMSKAAGVVKPARHWGDAAYDSERLHAFAFEQWGTRSYAPLMPRNGDGRVRSGRYRKLMKRRPRGYGRRWTIESMFSGLKRTTGAALSSRLERTLRVEAALRVLTYAIRR